MPEVASRQHLRLINPVIEQALAEAGASFGDIERVAVTTSPGLIGALLIGVASAKAIAYSLGKPMTPVNHLDGHIAANYLQPEPAEPPFLCLIASGGHTSIVHVKDRGSAEIMGRTLDDAAGEALDKGARLLGLDYPGGAELDYLSRQGSPDYVKFPIAINEDKNLNFSFSGVKTSLYYYLRDADTKTINANLSHIAASYQQAIVSALVKKTMAAAQFSGSKLICLSGGVSANSELRRQLSKSCKSHGLHLRIPPPELCTDNAAMIASAARFLPSIPFPEYLALDARA